MILFSENFIQGYDEIVKEKLMTDWRQSVNFYTNSYDIDLCLKMSHIYFDRVNENNSKKAESKVCFMVLLLSCLFVSIKANYLAILCFSYSSVLG